MRRVPPLEIQERDDHEVALLAHLIRDGSFVERPIRYASQDEACLATVATAAWHLFGITAARHEHDAARVVSLRLPSPHHLTRGRRDPIAEWLEDMRLLGLRSHEKFVPDWVFSLPPEQVALFLRNLWVSDGSGHVTGAGRGRASYVSTSCRLVDDVARLLARFDVSTEIHARSRSGYRPCYQLQFARAEDQQRFLEDVGVHAARSAPAAVLQGHRLGLAPARLDTVRHSRFVDMAHG